MLDDVLALAGEGVHLADAVHLVAKELHPDGGVAGVSKVYLHRVAPDAELVAHKVDVVALVLQLHQPAAQLVPVHLHAGPQTDDHAAVVDGVAQTVNAGDAGHDDDVPPLGEGRRGGVAQTVYFVVDGTVLLDVGVGGGDVGLRLIVIVVRNEVLHRILGEKLPELGAQLGSQRFIVGQHQCGPVHLGDDVGHGEGLAAAGHAQQSLGLVPPQDALGQFVDGLGLVAGGLIAGNKFKLIHGSPFCLARGLFPCCPPRPASASAPRRAFCPIAAKRCSPLPCPR